MYLRRLILLAVFAAAPVTPAAAASHYDDARRLYREENYFDALVSARKALDEDAASPYHHHIKGLILAALEQFSGAEESLTKAIEIHPAEAAFHYDLGYIFHHQRKYAEALPRLKKAVELNGENLMARFLLARAYVSAHRQLLIGDFSRLALEQLEFVASRNPGFPSVHFHLAQIHLNEGRQQEALRELHAELQYHPQNTQARVTLGELLIKESRFEEALDELLQAERDDAASGLLYYNLAKAYEGLGQDDQALQAALKGAELAPDWADARYLLALLYRAAGENERATEQMKAFQRLKSQETQ